MREVLFRGKRKDNGEWVYGYYLQIGDVGKLHYIHTGKLLVYKGNVGLEQYEVIPESVSEFTGLTDKNGKKIFEGDIVRVSQAKIENAVIKVEERTASIILEWIDTDKCNFMLDFYLKYGMTYTGIFEVIGNIHDNPELLKGGAE